MEWCKEADDLILSYLSIYAPAWVTESGEKDIEYLPFDGVPIGLFRSIVGSLETLLRLDERYDDKHNEAPSVQGVLGTQDPSEAITHVGGYAILGASGRRNDCRVSVTTIYTRIPDNPIDAFQLGAGITGLYFGRADEAMVVELEGEYRGYFWWD